MAWKSLNGLLQSVALEQQSQRPEIDGLRAFAIIPVVLFHAGLGCQAGFIGVDVFFVISGFLITGIILRELNANKFSFGGFWLRRLRRLFPALVVFFSATFLVGWKILFPSQLASLADEMIPSLLAAANFKMHSLLAWYWAPQANTIPLLHIWSLAVEEQFYFLMPVLLWAAHRWFGRWIDWLVLFLLVVSLSCCCHFTRTDPGFNFYMLPSRAWELLAGCFGACLVRRGFVFPRQMGILAAGLGLWMIIFSVFYLGNVQRWPNLWTVLPVLGTTLVLISPEPEGQRSPAVRLLSIRPLRFIGLISYSLYLWHWPLLVFITGYKAPEQLNLLDRWLIVAVSIGLAALSWRFVEQPFRRGTGFLRIAPKPFVIGAAAVWLVLMTISVWARKTGGFEANFAANLSPPVRRVILPPKDVEDNDQYDATRSLFGGGVKINGSNSPPRCVVIGDSHGTTLGPVIESLSRDYHLSSVMLTQGGTPGFFADTNTFVALFGASNSEKRRRDETVKSYIKRWKPDLLIVAGRWTWQMTYCWGSGRVPSTAALEQACRQSTSWLAERCGKVVIVGDGPILPLEDAPDNGPQIWKLYWKHGNALPKLFEESGSHDLRYAAMALLRRAADPRVVVLDATAPFQNPDGSVRYYNESGALYRDNNHLNKFGALVLRPLLEPFFQQIAWTAQQSPSGLANGAAAW